jgi:hypothetical protein
MVRSTMQNSSHQHQTLICVRRGSDRIDEGFRQLACRVWGKDRRMSTSDDKLDDGMGLRERIRSVGNVKCGRQQAQRCEGVRFDRPKSRVSGLQTSPARPICSAPSAGGSASEAVEYDVPEVPGAALRVETVIMLPRSDCGDEGCARVLARLTLSNSSSGFGWE